VDEFSREALSLEGARSLTARNVVKDLDRLVSQRGAPEFIRSDNGPEFAARAVKDWIARRGIPDRFHRTGKPLAERLHRELQLAVAGRVPESGSLREPAGSKGAWRRAPLQIQSPETAFLTGGPDPGGVCVPLSLSAPASGLRCKGQRNPNMKPNSHNNWSKIGGTPVQYVCLEETNANAFEMQVLADIQLILRFVG
jgi:hypothetical protein